MAGHTTDNKYAALIAQGFSGNITEMMLQWAQAYGATDNQTNLAILQALQASGATSGDITDAWNEVLILYGYSGSRLDMKNQFWSDGGYLSMAIDTFTDTDATNLTAHVTDSGHSWLALNGQIDIVGNEADCILATGGWVHYYLDLSAETKAPSLIKLDIKNSDAVSQNYGFSLRDAGDDANFVWCSVTIGSIQLVVEISTYIAGAKLSRATITMLGDYRGVDFNSIHVHDTGDSIILDAESIAEGSTVTWGGATGILSANKNIGLYSEAGALSESWDNLVVRG